MIVIVIVPIAVLTFLKWKTVFLVRMESDTERVKGKSLFRRNVQGSGGEEAGDLRWTRRSAVVTVQV